MGVALKASSAYGSTRAPSSRPEAGGSLGLVCGGACWAAMRVLADVVVTGGWCDRGCDCGAAKADSEVEVMRSVRATSEVMVIGGDILARLIVVM